MNKKKDNGLGDIFQAMKETLTIQKKEESIPDIMTFIESPEYLGFSALVPPIRLYPAQRILLKCFYRGSKGNENLTLDEEEIKFIQEKGLNDETKGSIMDKWNSGEIFNELVIVWGRRSGKSFFTSIIALYEAMRLMKTPNGDPYAYYNGLGKAAEITILTIAGSAEQAKILFKEIKDKIMASPYFEGKFYHDTITMDRMYLLTPKNIRDNEESMKKGWGRHTKGSILIRSGHSNSNTLVGISCFVVLFDEVATFRQTGGSSSGDQLYGNLSPTLITYARKEKKKDPKTGEMKEITVYDGKMISISSPRGKDGKFWELYSSAAVTKNRLMSRMPTWEANPIHTVEGLREKEPDMPEEKFMMEYGAEFSGASGVNFFPIEDVDHAFEDDRFILKDHGEIGLKYYAHLDPAFSSHNYTIAIVHKHLFLNEQFKPDFNIVLDHLKVFTPKKGRPVTVEEVDEYMIHISKRFNIALATYDQWNSQSSIEKLRKHGIPSRQTRFTKRYKIMIYDELYNLLLAKKLKLPHHDLLYAEMKHLQRKYIGSGGYKVFPKRDGEVRTDDCVDALAGACFNAHGDDRRQLAPSSTIHFGGSKTTERQWQSMSGPISANMPSIYNRIKQ